MFYNIGEVAKKMNIASSTLRYYDKEGLLPFVDRTEGGIRKFKEDDFEWLSIIECLKNTGMSIKDIKIFIDWCMEGDSTLQQRYDMFLERKRETENQIKTLQDSLEKINYKCWYYKTALEAGTAKIHDNLSENNENVCPYSHQLLSEISNAE
jgi:DNA-binding transcriptional MerR regulator